jgi:hypothetical protein
VLARFVLILCNIMIKYTPGDQLSISAREGFIGSSTFRPFLACVIFEKYNKYWLFDRHSGC